MRIIAVRADDELALRLEKRARNESKTVEDVAAEALRAYTRSTRPLRKNEGQGSARYRIKPFASGKCRFEDLSDTAQVLASAEGEDFR